MEGLDWDHWWPIMLAGMVRYADYRTETIDEEHTFAPVMTKRRSFAHEREFRAIVHIGTEPDMQADIRDLSSDGVSVPYNLERLIESIWVAPQSPEWFAKTVRRVLSDAGLTDVDVFHSELDRAPFF